MKGTEQSEKQAVATQRAVLSRRSVIRHSAVVTASVLLCGGSLVASAEIAPQTSGEEQPELSVTSYEDFLGGV